MKIIPLNLLYRWLVGYVVLAGLIVTAIGTWPTWKLAGWEGLRAELAAGVIVTVLTLASGAVLARRSRLGPAAVTMAFLSLTLLRVAFCAGLGVAAWRLWDLHKAALLLWTCAFYLAMLAGEGLWLVRSLRRDATAVALRRICRTSRGWTLRV